MYKKERDRPFDTSEEVQAYHHREKIPCLECGKLLIFLPRHIWFKHGMRANEYREKWNIPKHIALAGISYLEKRSLYMKERIEKGYLDPVEQIAMMKAKMDELALDPEWRNRSSSKLKIRYSRQYIMTNKIWKRSPAIKIVSAELKEKAIKRMKNRKRVGEKVEDIAADLNISVSRLYHWLKVSG
ncbi:transcriptional regulator [Salmonella enterica]|nr:transcriptional regulator [Salmonella enterica]